MKSELEQKKVWVIRDFYNPDLYWAGDIMRGIKYARIIHNEGELWEELYKAEPFYVCYVQPLYGWRD